MNCRDTTKLVSGWWQPRASHPWAAWVAVGGGVQASEEVDAERVQPALRNSVLWREGCAPRWSDPKSCVRTWTLFLCLWGGVSNPIPSVVSNDRTCGNPLFRCLDSRFRINGFM